MNTVVPHVRTHFEGVKGVTFTNPDGTKRQEIIATLHKGDRLLLEREPQNQYDQNAIKVLTEKHQQIGYVAKKSAEQLAAAMDAGHNLAAKVIKVGMLPSTHIYGVVMVICDRSTGAAQASQEKTAA